MDSKSSNTVGVYIQQSRKELKNSATPPNPEQPPPTSLRPAGWAGCVSPVKRSPAQGGQWQSNHACQDHSACVWIPPPLLSKKTATWVLWTGTDSTILLRDQKGAGTKKRRVEIFRPHNICPTTFKMHWTNKEPTWHSIYIYNNQIICETV